MWSQAPSIEWVFNNSVSLWRNIWMYPVPILILTPQTSFSKGVILKQISSKLCHTSNKLETHPACKRPQSPGVVCKVHNSFNLTILKAFPDFIGDRLNCLKTKVGHLNPCKLQGTTHHHNRGCTSVCLDIQVLNILPNNLSWDSNICPCITEAAYTPSPFRFNKPLNDFLH